MLFSSEKKMYCLSFIIYSVCFYPWAVTCRWIDSQEENKKPVFVNFASFHSINIPGMTNWKLPIVMVCKILQYLAGGSHQALETSSQNTTDYGSQHNCFKHWRVRMEIMFSPKSTDQWKFASELTKDISHP